MESGNMNGNSQQKIMKNDITNTDYNTALINIDNLKIMQNACKKYRGILDTDDIKSCKMIGLWKALGEFDEKYGIKFTTFLYNVVRNECRKRLRQTNKKVRYHTLKSNTSIKSKIQVEDILTDLQYPISEIMRLRYIDSMSIKDISNQLGMNKNSVRRNIKKAINKIRQEWI